MNLGDRMKRYEEVTKFRFTRRTPVILRVDGKAFHTWTKGLEKPFDGFLIASMADAAKDLMEHMQGCKLAYIQSDEASFLLTDWEELTTEPWLGNSLQKMVSVSSSIMTASFNKWWKDKSLAFFDARAFQLPKEEVANYFLWRAKDWHRNSIQMFARAFFSHKECHKKSLEDLHEMLHTKGKNWTTNLRAQERNGTFIYKAADQGGASEGYKFDSWVLPTFEAVNGLVEKVLPK